MENMHIREGLFIAMRFSELGNKFLQDQEPWKLIKTDKAACAEVVFLSLNLVRLVALLCEPFMPGFSGKIYNQLNLEDQYENNLDLLGRLYNVKSDRGVALLTTLNQGHKINQI